MSEKLTFQELIESIAEETDNSKQFTRDFLKDFVDVISDGLKSGDSINIAGFGKFKLRQVDERQGYNPQTKEKMTIAAHNKMIFKPYKDLREVVNAPYAHLEPTLIKDEKSEVKAEKDQQDVAKSDDEESKAERNPVIDELESLISDEEKSTDEAPEALSFSASDFMPDEKKETDITDNIEDSTFEKESDIVEYHEESAEDKNEMEANLAELMGAKEDEFDGKKEEVIDEVNYSPASPLGTEREEEKIKEEVNTLPSAVTRYESSKKSSSVPVLLTAMLLVIIAAGAWYYSTLSNTGIQQAEDQSLITAAAVQSKDADADQSHQTKTASRTVSYQSNGMVKNGSNSMNEFVIAKGATLWSIADEQFGNPRLWPWIYDTNQTIENPNLIFAGSTLMVPQPSGIPTGLSAKDSIALAKGYIATYQWYKNNHSPKAKTYLLVARKYHEKIRSLADVQIDKADLNFVKSAR